MILLLRNVFLFVFFLTIFYCQQLKASTNYYRTINSGFWKDPTVWQVADDINFTLNVLNALNPPDFNDERILVCNTHTIIIDQSLTIDETIVEKGGALIYGNFISSVISINNGIGVDLIINGIFEDNGPFNINWSNSQAKWELSSTGTIIRTRSTSATLWRDHFQGGMSSIPVGSNWIIRKHGVDNPSISAVSTYYGNLKIENYNPSFWNATIIGSKFIGASSSATIKGNMEIGGNKGYGVKFYSQNSAPNLILIEGDLIINQGSEFNLQDASTTHGASGINIKGNMVVNGILSYDNQEANDSNRIVKFSGTSDQFISGVGILLLFNLKNDKNSGDLILETNLSIDNKLTLENGALNLNKQILYIQNNFPLAIERKTGWVRSEAFDNSSKISWNIGKSTSLYEFPFGKDSAHYIPFFLTNTFGDMGEVIVSTYKTNKNNLPLPITPILVTNIDFNGYDNSPFTVDRFWQIDKTGNSGIATLSFSYDSLESPSANSIMFGQRYNSFLNIWESPSCCQNQDLINHKVTVSGIKEFSVWTLMESNDPLYLGENSIESGPNFKKVTSSIIIYPNPFQELLFVKYYLENDSYVTIELLNGIGEILFSENVNSLKGSNDFELKLSDLSARGLLFLRFKGEKKVEVVKVYRN